MSEADATNQHKNLSGDGEGGTGSLDDFIVQAEKNQVSATELSQKYGFDKKPNRKKVASDGTQYTLSGWKEYPECTEFTRVSPEKVIEQCNDIGHNLRSAGAKDQGILGKYNASHAEKQMSIISDKPIGISNPMCKDCKEYFSTLANSLGRTIVTADPQCIRIFQADGTVKEIIR